MTVRGGVGDILPGVLPAHFVAAVLHQPDEVFTVTSQGHALVDADFQIQLPTLPLVIGAVLPVGHGVFLLLFLLWFHDRKTVLQTQLVRGLPQRHHGFLVAVILFPGFAAYGVDDKVGMDVIPVCVGCHHDFEAGDLFRQLQRNLVGHLRGDRIIGTEGLNHVVVHPSPGAVVLPFGVNELLKGALGNAVDASDQPSALTCDFGFLTTVAEDSFQTACCLGACVLHEVDDGHYFHRLVLRISESKELTCVYASVSSLR